MQNQLDQFNSLWESFITALKGSLINLVKANELDFGHAKAALAEQAMSWQSDYESEGRWINQLITKDDAKGKLVRKILTQDMRFSELAKPGVGNGSMAIGAIGGAAIGYGISAISDFHPVATLATTVAAAAIGGTVGKVRSIKKRDKIEETIVNGYISQLDSYYHSVVAALNA